MGAENQVPLGQDSLFARLLLPFPPHGLDNGMKGCDEATDSLRKVSDIEQKCSACHAFVL